MTQIAHYIHYENIVLSNEKICHVLDYFYSIFYEGLIFGV